MTYTDEELRGMVADRCTDPECTCEPQLKAALAAELLTRRARDVEREKEIERLRKVVEAAKVAMKRAWQTAFYPSEVKGCVGVDAEQWDALVQTILPQPLPGQTGGDHA